MSSSIYSRLALTNLKNNRKTYIPYILTAVLTIMMFYIMDALSKSSDIVEEDLKAVLKAAVAVIVLFSVIFLFYTNSFLIKRRKKEIGVYNILGMGKQHIAKMLFVETLITAGISIVAGILSGLVFSKLMYLILLKILHYDVGMRFGVSVSSLVITLVLFVGIFLLTMIYNLMQIRLANPVELLHGSSQGEKEPKTKWMLTIFGIVMLGIGYGIAIFTESPLSAIGSFLLAVICVIIGTYALFTAGSIALLKMLKKRKNFYYKTNHFTAVSGMVYRMKQNAVGLANICILSTMVLVMISSTVSLYMGMSDIMKYRFPTEFMVKASISSRDTDQKVDRIIEEELEKNGVQTKDQLKWHMAEMAALKEGESFRFSSDGQYTASGISEMYLMPLDDFNRLQNTSETLQTDEVLVYAPKNSYGKKEIRLGTHEYRVKRELKTMVLEKKNKSSVVDSYYVILRDTEQIQQILEEFYQESEDSEMSRQLASLAYRTSFDLKGDEKGKETAMETIKARIENEVPGSFCESRELNWENFYSLYGGLLFIGIYLGLMFLMATVLIIYYKQISEGYDDKERYQIMQKVGMSKREVKRSIRSQVLIVFFMPLIMAVIHIVVAFKVITKLLAVMNLVNVPLFLGCTAVTVAVFAAIYAVVFVVTAREYYKIVN